MLSRRSRILQRSTKIMHRAPTLSDSRTGRGWKSFSLMKEWHRRPSTLAGNDVKMGVGMPRMTYAALMNGQLKREDLKASVRRLLTMILRLR